MTIGIDTEEQLDQLQVTTQILLIIMVVGFIGYQLAQALG